MPESGNVEVAHKLTEGEQTEEAPRWWYRLIDFGEVVILALVAVATAYSGFQATKWDGRQSLLYGQASRDRFQADAQSTAAGQEVLVNASVFTTWLQAHSAGNAALETQLEDRFTSDYRAAFDAWLALDPFANPSAPPGPTMVPAYHNPFQAKADQLNATASRTFDEGTNRETPLTTTHATRFSSRRCSSLSPSDSASNEIPLALRSTRSQSGYLATPLRQSPTCPTSEGDAALGRPFHAMCESLVHA